ncbi:uncharacterized protein LOC126828251 [Patella vulgata]|uniref:uncharacterized protein LOC126828251 n=1 Tax=Patella vulgata TaxID=6465 RepID=UPI0024A82D94|nr:uncharacterized protein LOC126828251 [Patella vulgata]
MDDPDLSALTSHPSYARTISMEIGRGATEESEPKPRIRRKSSKKYSTELFPCEDDLNDSDLSDVSDISEYFSAEEEFESMTLNESVDQEDDLLGSDCSSSSSDYACFLDNHKSDKVKALSKKKKRRRRQQLKEKMLHDFSIPFQDVENLDLEVGDFAEDLESCAQNIQKTVPTLMDLCIKNLWKKSSNLSMIGYSLLPSKLKEIVNKYKRTRLFSSIQYSWLTRSLFHLIKVSRKYSNNPVWFMQYRKDEGKPDKLVYKYTVRTVWFLMKGTDNRNEEDGDQIARWLPYTIYFIGSSPTNIVEDSKVNILSVLCRLVDVMLQQFGLQNKSCKTDQQVIEENVDKVRKMLCRRYPDFVENIFDDVVPYIFWAHGNKNAAHYFLKLAQDATGYHRAYYLSEAARFYTQLNEPSLARKLHREASEVIFSLFSPLTVNYVQIKVQMLMLLANVYDQGPMTCEKSSSSYDSWQAVLQIAPSTPVGTWLEAVDAFFCYHSGMWKDGDVCQLQEGERFLENLVASHPYLYLHLSLIKALLRGDSLSPYQRFVSSTLYADISGEEGRDHIAGLQFCSDIKYKHDPWHVIQSYDGKIQLLKVMWRTQFLYMYTVRDDKCIPEADLCGSHLNLRLSDHGHLTGDFQMLLPPTKVVELDVYTGLQIFTPVTTDSNALYYEDLMEKCSNALYNPTMTEIYNFEGNTVHMLNVGYGANCIGNPSGMLYLYWTGNEGETARINLLRMIKKGWKEAILKMIEAVRHHHQRTDNDAGVYGSDGWAKEMKNALDYHYQKDAMFDMEIIQGRVSNKVHIEKTHKNIKKKTERVIKKREHAELRPFPNRIIDYVRYGHTLYIRVQLTTVSNYGVRGMFIDCSSKESFLHPKFEFDKSYRPPYMMTESINHVVPRTDILWVIVHDESIPKVTSSRSVYFYGQGGELLTTQNCTTVNNVSGMVLTDLVIGSSLFGYESHQNTVKRCHLCPDSEDNYEIAESSSREYSKINGLHIMADRLLLHLETEIIILDTDDCLTPIPVKVTFSSSSLEVKDGRIQGVFKAVKIISDKQRSDEYGNSYTEIVVAVDCHLLIFRINENNKTEVDLRFCVEVAGRPIEYCYINKQLGFLISTTQHYNISDHYREQVFHYNFDGVLLGVLPFLGPGPRDMFTLYLSGDTKTTQRYSRLGQQGRYVFMRDGHGGIMSIWLGPY